MQTNPYLFYTGQCETAFRYYEKNLGGKIFAIMKYGGTPGESEVPPDWRDKVIHARMTIGDSVLMGSDAPPGRQETPQGFSISFNADTPEDAELAFRALAEKGQVKMPIQETFWAERFGMLVDQFGIPWMVNCEKER